MEERKGKDGKERDFFSLRDRAAVQVHTILWRQILNRFIDQLDWIPAFRALGPRFNSSRSLYFVAVQKREGRKGKRRGIPFFFVTGDRAAGQLHARISALLRVGL